MMSRHGDEAGQGMMPVGEAERIVSLDVLRGVAILGIFLVNIVFFADVMAASMDPAAMAGEPLSEQLAWMVVRVFAEMKFMSLFSLLFGIRLVVQFERARQRGVDFRGKYLRRLLILMCIGLAHGLLLWYGDILFMYAVGGLVLFFFRCWRPGLLVMAAAVCLGLGWLLYGGLAGLNVVGAQFQPEDAEQMEVREAERGVGAVSVAAEGVDDRWERWRSAMRRWGQAHGNVLDASWAEAEMIAYKEGPMLATILTRAISFAGHVFVAGVFGGFGFRIMGMFLLGAALMKWNFFEAGKRGLHRQLFLWGMLCGLLLEAAAAWLYYSSDYQVTWGTFAAENLHWVGSFVLMWGYVGGVCMLVHAGVAQWLQRGLAAVGRMALSNYLMQSVVASFVMYWWGLRLFAELGRAQQVLLVLGVFVLQILLSVLWLGRLEFGPMEWVWRTLTYMRLQPLLRR